MIANLTDNETCGYCLNDGLVLVGADVRPVMEFRDAKGNRVACASLAAVWKQVGTADFDQYAPCPFCERGNVVEFPPAPKVGRWGKDGYWRGQSTEHLRPAPTSSFKKAPPSLVRDLLTNAGLLKAIPA